MRNLLIALASSVLTATLVALILIPQLPDHEPGLTRQSSTLELLPAPPLDCPTLRHKAWLTSELREQVDERSYQQIKAYVSGDLQADSKGLQLFGVYSGTPRIVLGAGAQPSNLMLTSAEKSIWSIELAANSQINRIFVVEPVTEVRLSRQPNATWQSKLQRVLGISPRLDQIELIRITREQTCGLYAYDWHKDDKAEFRSLLSAAQQLTGLSVQSFQGSYSAQPNSLPFTTPLPPAKHTTMPTPIPEKPPLAVTGGWVSSIAELRNTVQQLIDSGVLPSQVGSMDMGSGELMQLQAIDLSAHKPIRPDAQGNLDCPAHQDSALEGDDNANIADCAFGNTQFYGGSGKDLLDDAWGNDIIYGGDGDDTLDAGWGSDVLLFGPGWGQDKIGKTCHQARYEPSRTPASDTLDYRWTYNNFIIFGPGIAPQDLHWEGKRLIHRDGSSLTFKDGDACFNFVFADDPNASIALH